MRAIHLGLAALLLAVLTAGLWFRLERPPAVALAADAAAETGDAAHADASIEGAGNAGAAGRVTPAPSRIALAPPDAEPPKPAPAWKPGDEPKLRGRVVDPDGRGIAGATVLASGGAEWIRLPLDVEPEGLPKNWHHPEQTVTDEEGRFEFEKQKPGPLRIAARAAGHAPVHDDDLELPDRAEHTLADIVLPRSVVLAGRVVDREGQGVAGAALLRPLDCGRDSNGNEVAFPRPRRARRDDGRGRRVHGRRARSGTLEPDRRRPGLRRRPGVRPHALRRRARRRAPLPRRPRRGDPRPRPRRGR
jgi:protocatechuate 3,4-dioxygenase beta subunit